MSNFVNYSRFGTTTNITDIEALRGEPGYGFATDGLGNYDIQNNNFVNVDDIELNSITPATTNILFNGDLDMNTNDITNVHFTYTDGLIVDTLIAQDATNINLNNNIYGNGNDLTQLGDIKSIGQLFIASSLANPSSTAQIHIQDTQDAVIYLEGNTDNIGSESAFLKMSQYGGTVAYSVNGTGNNQNLEFLAGNSTGSNGFQFTIGHLVQPKSIGDLPTFIGPYVRPLYIYPTSIEAHTTLNMFNNNINSINNLDVQGQISNSTGDLQINDTVNFNANIIDDLSEINPTLGTLSVGGDIDMSNKDLYVNNVYLKGFLANSGTPIDIQVNNNIDMQTNDILNIGLLDFATQPTNNDAQTRLLVVDATTGNVQYRNASSILNNPFDQSLNTIDSVTFGNETINGNLNMTQGDITNLLNLTNTANNINVNPQTNGLLNLSSGSNIRVQSGYLNFNSPSGSPSTTAPAGSFNQSIYTVGGNLAVNVGLGSWFLNKTHNTYDYAESLAFSSTTSATNITKLTHTTGTLAIGTYEITYQCQTGTNSSMTTSSLVDFVADTVNQNGESCTSGLSGLTFGYSTISQTYKIYYSTATTHTYSIQYRSPDGVVTSHIRDARIFIKQIDQVSV